MEEVIEHIYSSEESDDCTSDNSWEEGEDAPERQDAKVVVGGQLAKQLHHNIYIITEINLEEGSILCEGEESKLND